MATRTGDIRSIPQVGTNPTTAMGGNAQLNNIASAQMPRVNSAVSGWQQNLAPATPTTNTANPVSFNPFNVNPTWMPGTGANYADLDTANRVAQTLGGTVRQTYSGLPNTANPVQYQILMPNGAMLNAGQVANTLYGDSSLSQQQRMAQIMADVNLNAGDSAANISNGVQGGFAASAPQSAQQQQALSQYYKSLGVPDPSLANNTNLNVGNPLADNPTSKQYFQLGQGVRPATTPTQNYVNQVLGGGGNSNNSNLDFGGLGNIMSMMALLSMFGGTGMNSLASMFGQPQSYWYSGPRYSLFA